MGGCGLLFDGSWKEGWSRFGGLSLRRSLIVVCQRGGNGWICSAAGRGRSVGSKPTWSFS